MLTSLALRLSIALLHSFLHVFLAIIFAEILGSPIFPLSDNGVIELLDRASDYGKERLWGAVGWGLMGILVGVIATYTSIYVFFICHASLIVLALLLAYFFPFKPRILEKTPTLRKE